MTDRFVLALTVAAMLTATATAEDSGPAAFFADRVRPLLAERCFSCHGPDKAKGGLRLDSGAAGLKGGDSGPAWVVGDPEKSLLIQAVRGTRPDLADRMPPKDPLSDKEIAALTAWVKDGAKWSNHTALKPNSSGHGDAWTDKDNPVRKAFLGERLDLWSLKKPSRPQLPSVKQPEEIATPIDSFIFAKLEAKRLKPSPEADRRTLIRRLTFDLHGLPPTPEEVAAFLADKEPNAYGRLVDRLLASPRYGERWARHWLDVVRYADTNGFERDEFRPQMWRYRDYVIRSFNNDKPYDRFVTEQLAGDELAAGEVRTAADADRWAATGFLRLGTHDTTAAIFNEADRDRDQMLTDLTNTTASAFLGLTYSCCQCHNHKYDPLTQADYYRMRAFFAAVKPAENVVLDLPVERAKIEAHNAAIDGQVKERKDRQAELVGWVKWLVVAYRKGSMSAEQARLLAVDPAKLGEKEKKTRDKIIKSLEISDEYALSHVPETTRKQYQDLKGEISDLEKKKLSYATPVAATEVGRVAPITHFHHQGDYKQPRDTVEPGIPSVFDPNPLAIPKVPTDTTGRRTALARWIVAKDNPLTARVMVNRLWHHHFGRGLVATPNDFGYTGTRPTHPELLDWLALEFVESGWSIKAMHKLMVMSATYRQSSIVDAIQRKVDPDNLLLSHQNPRRLDAESLRDALLAVSGRLLPDAGGPPRWPDVPEDILLSNPAIFEARKGMADGRLQDYYTDPAEKTDVRSAFLIQKRALPYPFLQPFDLPDPTVSCGCRPSSTVAPQALALLNSPAAARLTKAFAERVLKQAGDDPDKQIDIAFRLALGRPASKAEQKLSRGLIAEHSLQALSRAMLNLNEFVFID